MSPTTLPLVILGGSDRKPSVLPSKAQTEHPLAAYKGAEVRLADRPLVAHLYDRLKASGAFKPIWVAGPARLYQSLQLPLRIIDTDGTLGDNIRAASNIVGERSIALTTCDVLPTPHEINETVRLWRELSPCSLFFPLIRVPDDPDRLGSFGWKPVYQLTPTGSEQPCRVLPGHLVIAKPRALRLGFVLKLIDLAYRSRNRPIGYRRRFMVRHTLADLFQEDVRNLMRGRVPSLAYTVFRHALRTVRRLRRGELREEELEDVVARLMIRPRHRRHHPEEGVRIPLVDFTGWARDIDTEEEERQIASELND